jgi:hypothetical protein
MENLIFAFMTGFGEAEKETLMLVRSIRAFAGKLRNNPIWVLMPPREENLSEGTNQELSTLGARLIPFEVEPDALKFPFATYVTATGVAEGLAQGQAGFLAWMVPDTLVLQEPKDFLLGAGKSLGGCSVHLKLLGSGLNEPINEFWSLIYQHCQVATDRIFAMQTTVDEEWVRAYFNSGLLVVRPERGLLRAWQANFERLYRLPEYEAFYQQHDLYKIFIHQAILAGSILSLLKPEEIQQLPFEMNYPLHLHTRVPAAHRPASLNRLITCRYEDYAEFFGDPTWEDLIPVEEPLRSWLHQQVKGD